MAGNVFHVQFGFNDTPLTRALESGNYTIAEKIILATTNPSSLDEGCYQRTPLYICLCGVDMEGTKPRPRNIYLARLLIEHGANVDYRVPTTYFGSEYSGPGKSPLELLVDFYIDLTCSGLSSYGESLPTMVYSNAWDPKLKAVIGINRQYLTTREDIIDHVETLVFLILGAGGNANIQDQTKKTPLHRLAILSHDVRLFKLLCENGADINSTDGKGNSPLLSLCDVSVSEMYDFMEDQSICSTDTLGNASENLRVKRDFLNFILKQKGIQINKQNNMGHTALFHCVIRGDVCAVQTLLQKGADPSIKGTVWETRKQKRRISPLFATFLSVPVQRVIPRHSTPMSIVIATRQYAHLIDAGYFSGREISDEIHGLLNNEFAEFSHLSNICNELVAQMFGQTTATLKQLATRSVLQQCFIKQHSSCFAHLFPAGVTTQNVCYGHDQPSLEDQIHFQLNTSALQTLIKHLGLPCDFLVNFEVELLLCRIAHKFCQMKPVPPEDIFYDSDGGSMSELLDSESTDYSEEYGGDSDLEYW